MLKWFLVTCICSKVLCDTPAYTIIGLFEKNENDETANYNELAFNYSTKKVNEIWGIEMNNLDYLLEPDDPYPALKSACSFISKAPVAVFGPQSLQNIYAVQSVCDAKEVPQILTRWLYKPLRSLNAVNFYPHSSKLSEAFKAIIKAWDWKTFTILYDNDESLLRMSDLIVSSKKEDRIVNVEQLSKDDTGTYRTVLKQIWKSQQKYFVIDCHIDKLIDVLTQCQQVGLMTSQHNYLITNLDAHTLTLSPFQYSETNLTGVRIIDPRSKTVASISTELLPSKSFFEAAFELRTETALIYDSIMMVSKVLSESNLPPPTNLNCDKIDSWKFGYTLTNLLKTSTYKGLTGHIQFDQEGNRSSFGLHVYELREGGILDIAYWNSTVGLNITRAPTEPEVYEPDNMSNKTFTVIITLTEPYGMLKESAENLVGNDRFEGFGVDLIHELSKLEGFNYTFIVQVDRANGKKGKNGKWTGMLGKVLDGVADMAITDLTITLDRAQDFDFTSPFMTLGVSILFEKPKKAPPNFFSFAEPFAMDTWIALALAFVVVSLSFFILARICPDEWTNPYPCEEEPEFLINQFSLTNSVWFATGAMLLQGSEIGPIAIPTRLVSGSWWFFVLIVVSSYTANLASFLVTENNMELFTDEKSLVENAEKYGIRYGAKLDGATFYFFNNSEGNYVYEKIAKHMREHKEDMPSDNDVGIHMAKTKKYAFFMESTSIDYTTQRHCNLTMVGERLDEKGYGIALQKNSPYRTRLSTAILKLQSLGVIDKIRVRWWEERKGGGQCTDDDENTEATALNLRNVEGIYYVTLGGAILGAFLVLFEYALSILRISRRTKISFMEALKHEIKFFFKFNNNVKPVIGSASQKDENSYKSPSKSESSKSKTKSAASKVSKQREQTYGFIIPRNSVEFT